MPIPGGACGSTATGAAANTGLADRATYSIHQWASRKQHLDPAKGMTKVSSKPRLQCPGQDSVVIVMMVTIMTVTVSSMWKAVQVLVKKAQVTICWNERAGKTKSASMHGNKNGENKTCIDKSLMLVDVSFKMC